MKCCYVSCQSNIPEFDISQIPRINRQKFWDLWNSGIQSIYDLPLDFKLSDNQSRTVDQIKNKETSIDTIEIERSLNNLVYPLYFLDYETYQPAVPIFKNYAPYEKFVFQYSLHAIEDENSDPIHYEFVIDGGDINVERVVQNLASHIGQEGSILVWNEGFEKSCNRNMAGHYSKYSDFLEDLNSRVFDLMKIFTQGFYQDYRFKGSNSIKSVLPILIPELSYDQLNISKGDVASYRWRKAVIDQDYQYPEKRTLAELLEYCKLDTLAMVEIYKFLRRL